VSQDANFFPAATDSAPFLTSSFFDIFTELSLDGGPFTTPNNLSGQSLEFDLTPEPSGFWLFATGGPIALVGWRCRRKAAATAG
jgi:hypothetical protein